MGERLVYTQRLSGFESLAAYHLADKCSWQHACFVIKKTGFESLVGLMHKVSEHRRRRKKQLVEHFGGACILCGYSRSMAALQFHHRDPTTKAFGLSASGVTRKWEDVLAEAEKCDLLCANCHAETHVDFIPE